VPAYLVSRDEQYQLRGLNVEGTTDLVLESTRSKLLA